MRNVVPVVLVDALRVEQQLVQVIDVLPDDGGHILKLGEFVAVVLCKHALGANYRVANLAEVLDLLVLMLQTEYLASHLVGDRTTSSIVHVLLLALVVFRVIVLGALRRSFIKDGIGSCSLIPLVITAGGRFIVNEIENVEEFLIQKQRVRVLNYLPCPALSASSVLELPDAREAESVAALGQYFGLFGGLVEFFMTLVALNQRFHVFKSIKLF